MFLIQVAFKSADATAPAELGQPVASDYGWARFATTETLAQAVIAKANKSRKATVRFFSKHNAVITL